MPPEVEPAQAHCKVKNIKISCEKGGHGLLAKEKQLS